MPSILRFQATPAEHQQVGKMPWNMGVLLLYFLLELIKEGCLSENLQQAFRVEPDNVTVREGEAALLKCEVENPSGIVQWAKDGLLLGPDQNIPRFPRYSMVGEPDKGKYDLQVARSRLEDDASYECQVGPSEDSNGLISRRVQLTVLIPPKKAVFTEYEANSTVTWVAGKEYTVHCQVEDARPPAEIVFRKGAHELADVTSSIQPGSGDKLFHTEAMLKNWTGESLKQRYLFKREDSPLFEGLPGDSKEGPMAALWETAEGNSATHSGNTLTPESLDNQQLLLCRASNIAAPIPVTLGLTMNVLFPPQPPVIRGYDGPAVKAKDKLVLTCVSLSGNPLATLQWLKNDEVISTNWETDKANQLSRSSLSLQITANDNMATVSCQALNSVLPAPLQASMVLPVVFPPEEVKITGSSSAQENKAVSLSCSTSSSNPPVLLRWLLGWKEINATEVTVSEAANGGMITVSNLTYITNREDNGLPLVCEAFNEAIMYTKTDTVTLRVTYPPQKIWIDVPPPETYFRAGTKVKLSCFASGGNPAPRLEWYKTTCTQVGGDIETLVQRKLPPGQSGLLKPCMGRQETKAVRDGTSSGAAGNIVSKELILTTSPSDNLAIYRCNATGPSRTTPITASTFLRVQFPPLHVTITTEDKELRRGQTVTLMCKSGSSHPPASLTWLKDGQKLNATNLGQKKAEYGGFSTSGRVTLVVSSADHGKRVECHAYSPILSEGVNSFYQLTVLFPPEFSHEQPLVVQTVEHEAVLLPLLVSASPPEITYRWIFLGEVLLTEGSPRYHLRDGGSLEIWNVTRADTGLYKIHCENPEGYNEMTILLDVQYSPSIRSIGDPTYVDLGGTAEIVCQADANPAPESMFQWRWLGDLEQNLEELGIELRSEGLVGRLHVQEAQRAHAGLYECQVDNGISPAARSSARLIVRYAPEIIKGPGERKVAASGDGRSQATLRCSAQGVPMVFFSWAKNGVSLDLPNSRHTVVTDHEGPLHTSTLTIANVSAVLDYATFTCTARNELGVDTLDIQLLSTSRPDSPTGLKVVGVSHNWLALEWTPGFDGGLQQSFRVRYHWPGAPSFLYVDVFPPQSTTFTITGLYPNTLYNVSVNARNFLGESDFADGGVGLSITTEERKETAIDGEPTTTSVPESESPVLPLPLFGLLGALGGLLIMSNLFLLGCFFCRRRAQSLKGTQGAAKAKVRFGNNYTVFKWLKAGAQPEKLEEHSSEGSSAKTSTTGSGATSHSWTQLGHRVDSETDASGAGPSIPPPWPGSPELHEYEEVRMPRRYDELGPLYEVWYPEEAPRINEYAHVYQSSGASLGSYAEMMQIYDPVVDYLPLDRDLPFEQQGELV